VPDVPIVALFEQLRVTAGIEETVNAVDVPVLGSLVRLHYAPQFSDAKTNVQQRPYRRVVGVDIFGRLLLSHGVTDKPVFSLGDFGYDLVAFHNLLEQGSPRIGRETISRYRIGLTLGTLL
jgi:hypothetical protein